VTKAQRWKKLRDAGYTAKDVAAEVPCAASTAQRVMNGVFFSLPVAEFIAAKCGLTVAEMFPRSAARALRKAAA
jgi:hypothetical protein